ncbi:GLTT repeat protein [Microvirga lotononidis]|uniref:GLTT repeat protein n=1 Tax=Microvirga lotononidis TaxID=864069 RepID=I4YNA3_9HYPH|nr:GLTT repeat protein [Microvirga lotononidis]EIM25445.1 GLTT repeat protein [Microvirga lotononidis]WQO26242.1 hypothetical protein U0023_16245 [Microvirga lotononidis]
MRIKTCISIFPIALGLSIATGASALEIANGLSTNGLSTNGLATNGLSTNGLSTNGLSTNGHDTTGSVSPGARLEAVILQDGAVFPLVR